MAEWEAALRALRAVHRHGTVRELAAVEKALRELGDEDPAAAAVLFEWYAELHGEPEPVALEAENPGSRARAAALKLFESWHGYEPDQVSTYNVPPLDGQPMVFLGNLLRIDYESPKWSQSKAGSRPRRGYWHKSTGRPLVLSDPTGRVLVIFDPSGRMRVTADGLEN